MGRSTIRTPVEPGIHKITTEDGLRYEATRRMHGKPEMKRCRSKHEARLWRAEATVNTHYTLFEQETDLTLRDYLEPWLKVMRYPGNTERGYRTAILLRFAPLLDRKLAAITSDDIDDLVADFLGEGDEIVGRKASTILKGLAALDALFTHACGKKKLRHNPMDGVTRPKKGHVEPVWMQPAEIPVFVRFIEGHEKEALILLLLEAGLRVNEALFLDWRHIDWKARTVTVEGTMIRRGKPARLKRQEYPKSRAGFRTVPLSRRLLGALERQRAYAKTWCQINGDLFTEGTPVFPSYGAAGRFTAEGTEETLMRICLALRMPYYGPHALRHTCGTELWRRGVDPQVAAERMGHSVRTYQEVYVHTDPGSHDEAQEELETALYGKKVQ